jgi:hypothetical protein
MNSHRPISRYIETLFRPLSLLILGFLLAVAATVLGEKFSAPPAPPAPTGGDEGLTNSIDDVELVNAINSGQFKPYEIGSKEIHSQKAQSEN